MEPVLRRFPKYYIPRPVTDSYRYVAVLVVFVTGGLSA